MHNLDLNLNTIREDEDDQKNDTNQKETEKQIPPSKFGKNKIAPRMVESKL